MTGYEQNVKSIRPPPRARATLLPKVKRKQKLLSCDHSEQGFPPEKRAKVIKNNEQDNANHGVHSSSTVENGKDPKANQKTTRPYSKLHKESQTEVDTKKIKRDIIH